MKTKPISRFSGRIDPKHNERVLAGLAYTVRRAWEAACRHDGIPTDSTFVCFSDNNPYVEYHSLAVRQFQEAQQEARAGGYIGLQLG